MTNDVSVRFYCLAIGEGPSIAFDYLNAMNDAGVAIKACPIGPMFLSGRWSKLMHLFVGPQMPAQMYVNIVCAPFDLLLGCAMTKAAVAPACAPCGPVPDPADIAYSPMTALSGLYTIGVPNMAIVWAPRQRPMDGDIQAVRRYHHVITPTSTDQTILTDLGIDHISLATPREFAANIVKVVDLLPMPTPSQVTRPC